MKKKVTTEMVSIVERILIEYGAINPKYTEDYNCQYNTSHKKLPSFFTPFESNQEAAIVALDTIVKPFAAIAASLYKPYETAPSETNSLPEAIFIFSALYLTITPVFIATAPCIAISCIINFLTRSLATIVNEFNELLSNNSQAESSFHAAR